MDILDHKDKYKDGRALIILGGPSAKNWEIVKTLVNPDVVLGANGVKAMVPDLDYWMCIENMNRTARSARKGSPRAKEFMQMFQSETKAVRIVNRKSLELLPNKENVLVVQRRGVFGLENIPDNFSFREYGEGYIKGPLMDNTTGAIPSDLELPVGTVGLQLLHHAGILGVKEVYTIGFDLRFYEGKDHHAFKYPAYEANNYFSPGNFITFHGIPTMQFWVEGARFLLV